MNEHGIEIRIEIEIEIEVEIEVEIETVIEVKDEEITMRMHEMKMSDESDELQIKRSMKSSIRKQMR